MADIKFNDYSVEVIAALKELAYRAVEESCGELESQVKRNSPVGENNGSGLKNSWQHRVSQKGSETTGTVGSPLERSIWIEFGTGSYALKGNGRQGYWVYVDDGQTGKSSRSTKSYTLKEAKRAVAIMRKKGLNAYYSNGIKPQRPFWKAYSSLKNKLIRHMQDIFKGGMA